MSRRVWTPGPSRADLSSLLHKGTALVHYITGGSRLVGTRTLCGIERETIWGWESNPRRIITYQLRKACAECMRLAAER